MSNELPKLEPTQTRRYFELDGEAMCIGHWAKRFGMSYSTLQNRLDKGMTLREAVDMPVRKLSPPKPGRLPPGRKPSDEKMPPKNSWKSSPTRRVWRSLLGRCTDPKHVSYDHYRARGITMCEEWKEYYNFLRDMGERPEGTTLDRIDNDKGYYKENCRWATRKEQSRNMSSNRLITYNGETKCLAQWADDIGLEYAVLRSRLRSNWSVEKALTEPKDLSKSRKIKNER